MVLRMTGASWLATMMRFERETEEPRRDSPPPWLLDGDADPEVLEALERLEPRADRE
ncbi:hypothetical protein [Caulobacter sp.]|uniref:hypothetical protein n=1 Tax=Caulobacter sp. TaxID=78 RepID=UPI002B46EF49|nr:hypothetical protein [Caulobacter sp.]HJV41213.1 hypothetical protein [Caulobacter sp.]